MDSIFSFPSADGLIIESIGSFLPQNSECILFFHQARYNKTEYRETAVLFQKWGFNTLSVDLRSGGELNGEKNITYERAIARGLATDFLAAEQDMIAAIHFLYTRTSKPIIICGSSYSAGLAMKLAAEMKEVKAVISFSPGEYYGPDFILSAKIKELDKPLWVTGSRKEIQDIEKLLEALSSKENLHIFKPATEGIHGSKVLWNNQPDRDIFIEDLHTWLLAHQYTTIK